MNIGIIGSRKRNNREDFLALVKILTNLIIEDEDCIVSGGCKLGGDSFAEEIATKCDIPIIIHKPDSDLIQKYLDDGLPHKAAYAKAAYARNILIARDSDYLIALVSPDRKGGTEDTIKKFLKRLSITEEQAIIIGKLILL
jgi:hypothetical protein